LADRRLSKEIEDDQLGAAVMATRDFLAEHRNAVLLVAALVLVAVVVTIVVSHSRAQTRLAMESQLGEALFMMQGMDYTRAAMMLESLLERYPGGPLAHDVMYHCATAQFLAGNPARALELFENLHGRGLSDRMRAFAVQEGMADCHAAQGDWNRAGEAYERLAAEAGSVGQTDRAARMLAEGAACYEKAGNWAGVHRVAGRLTDEFEEGTQGWKLGTRFEARAKILEKTAGPS